VGFLGLMLLRWLVVVAWTCWYDPSFRAPGGATPEGGQGDGGTVEARTGLANAADGQPGGRLQPRRPGLLPVAGGPGRAGAEAPGGRGQEEGDQGAHPGLQRPGGAPGAAPDRPPAERAALSAPQEAL